MDPFEARLLFQQMLKTITSSSNNNILVSNFLLQNQELQEDFHSCILEALNVDDLNYKMNIFQLVDVIIQRSLNVPEKPYVRNIVRDFDLIVSKVLRGEGGGFSPVNLNSTFTILGKISKLLQFSELTKYQMEFRNAVVTKEETIEVEEVPVANRLDKEQVLHNVWELVLLIKRKSKQDRLRQDQDNTTSSAASPLAVSTTTSNNKTMLRRMEDDRERTKKLKETLWEINSAGGGSSNLQDEFNELVSKYNSNKKDGFKDMIELNGIVGQCYNDWTSNSIVSRK